MVLKTKESAFLTVHKITSLDSRMSYKVEQAQQKKTKHKESLKDKDKARVSLQFPTPSSNLLPSEAPRGNNRHKYEHPQATARVTTQRNTQSSKLSGSESMMPCSVWRGRESIPASSIFS